MKVVDFRVLELIDLVGTEKGFGECAYESGVEIAASCRGLSEIGCFLGGYVFVHAGPKHGRGELGDLLEACGGHWGVSLGGALCG